MPSNPTNTHNRAPQRAIAIIGGANLNLLGIREPSIYGHTTLADIENTLHTQAAAAPFALTLQFIQSNFEGVLCDFLNDIVVNQTTTNKNIDGLIINPAAFTHTSVALRDAIAATTLPFIEVHLSNIYAREPFRAHSYFSDKAQGVITGLGAQGYELALAWFVRHFANAMTNNLAQ